MINALELDEDRISLPHSHPHPIEKGSYQKTLTSSSMPSISIKSMTSPHPTPRILSPSPSFPHPNEKYLEVLDEFIEVEMEYVTLMNKALHCKDTLAKSALLAPHDLELIFGDLPHLLSLHSDLISHYEARRKETLRDISEFSWGDLLKPFVDSLKIYHSFFSSRAFANLLLDEYQSNSSLSPQLEKQLLDCGIDCSLGSLLSKPLSHLPKYSQFLKDFMKFVPSRHPDIESLKSAEVILNGVLVELNGGRVKSEKESEEEIRFLKQIEEMFKNENLSLLKTGRKLIKTGLFTLHSAKKKKKSVLVTLFLFNDLVLVTGVLKSKQQVLLCSQSSSLKINQISDTDKLKWAFELVAPEKSLILVSETQLEKVEWLKLLSSQQLKNDRKHHHDSQDKKNGMNDISSLSKFTVEDMMKQIALLDLSELESLQQLQNLDTKEQLISSLMEVEKEYIDDLITTIEIFMDPLEYSQIISRNEIWKIFSDLRSIVNININFCFKKMEKRLKQTEMIEEILLGDVFAVMAEELMRYETYISNLPTALSVVGTYCLNFPENKLFIDFIHNTKNNPRSKGHTLSFWLKRPLLHIFKYPSYIKRLFQLTQENDEDYDRLENAMLRMDRTIELLRYALKIAEMELQQEMETLTMIATNIEWSNNLKLPLNRPGRTLLRRAAASHWENDGSDNKEKSKVTNDIFIMNDSIIISTPQKNKKSILKSFIPYQHLTNPTESDMSIVFSHVQSPDTKIHLEFDNALEKEETFKTLKQAVQLFQQQRAERPRVPISFLSSSTPQPDSQKKQPFSLSLTQSRSSPEMPTLSSGSQSDTGSNTPVSWSPFKAPGRSNRSFLVGRPSKRMNVRTPSNSLPVSEEVSEESNSDTEVIQTFETQVLKEDPIPTKAPDSVDYVWDQEIVRKRETHLKMLVDHFERALAVLSFMKSSYLDPLESARLVSQQQSVHLFANLPKLLTIFENIVKEWHQCVESLSNKESLGTAPTSKMIFSHTKLLQQLKALFINKIIMQMAYKGLQDTNSVVNGIILKKLHDKGLPDLMASMEQWGTQYGQYLYQLVEITPRESPLYNHLFKAKTLFETVLKETAQEQKEFEQHMATLIKIEEDFGKTVSFASSPHRKLIRQNNGKEISGLKLNKSHDMSLFLFSDMLVFAEPKKKPKYKFIKSIPLNELQYSNKLDVQLAVNAITFLDRNNEITTISLESKEIKAMWLLDLMKSSDFPEPIAPIKKTTTGNKKKKERSRSTKVRKSEVISYRISDS